MMRTDDIACQDCGARFVDKLLKHEESCPISHAIDEVRDHDREWFETHPNATFYYRDAVPADYGIASFEGFMFADGSARMKIQQASPGVRFKHLPVLAIVIDPERPELTLDQQYLLVTQQDVAELPQKWADLMYKNPE